MAFETGGMPEDWRSAVIVPLYKGKGDGTECKNYKGISLLSVVGKIYARILVDRVHRETIFMMSKSISDQEDRWECTGTEKVC